MLNGDVKNGLRVKLLKFFKSMADAKDVSNFEQDSEEFLFHMTDWIEGLRELSKLYDNPDETTEDEAEGILESLIYHTLPHLNAAAEIYSDDPETYGMLTRKQRLQGKA